MHVRAPMFARAKGSIFFGRQMAAPAALITVILAQMFQLSNSPARAAEPAAPAAPAA
jgi:hypothetical protein